MSECSLVIRAYNEARHLPRLLEGVHRQSMAEVEVILVDSGSTDATCEIAAHHGARIVHIPPGEFTFGRSLNQGIAAASCSLVAIASAHVYPVYPDWLEKLLEPFKDAVVSLAYGRQTGGPRSKFSEQKVYERWYPAQSTLRQNHPFCNNANAAIRRAVWQEHPYDETLTGLEDLAWSRWAFEQGHAIAYVADAEVVHIHNEIPSAVMNRYRREAMAFKRIYPEAHFNLYDFLRNMSSSIGFDLLHALREGKFLRSLPSIFWYRTAQFWGTYIGYRRSGVLTSDLRQTFYYHKGWEKDSASSRDVEPIRYNE
jgi:rhamnosyltransferase